MAVTVAEVADVSPAHAFPGLPSFTHWALIVLQRSDD